MEPLRAFARTGVGRWSITCLKFGLLTSLFTDKVGGLRMTHGASMLPTLAMSTEYILEDALSVNLGRLPLRGELVILNSPRKPGAQICKRVIGLPGDVVCVDPTGEHAPSTEHCVIPKGHVWVVGDNASASIDSRTYGPVPIALIRARVLARVFPWKLRRAFWNEGRNVAKDIYVD
ncbi:hypothetical protein M0805_004103 [Coniferiporia weirii]|nr:hypothetical protein M0805_004103 [Coniferiporia weirii]